MVDVKLCEGCDYSADFYDTICCNYIGIVHRARPKSGGGQCTVFTPKTARQKTVTDIDLADMTYGECEPWHKENKCTSQPNAQSAHTAQSSESQARDMTDAFTSCGPERDEDVPAGKTAPNS